MIQILSRYKYLKKNCIFLINDPNYLTNLEIIKKISDLVKDELINFYTAKIKYYRNEYKDNENFYQKEYAIKYLIKTFLVSKLSNIINIDNTINYYDYIQKAYDILSQQLNKKTYIFCQPNIEVIYLELKNLADFLLLKLLSQNNITLDDIINLIIKYLANFDLINFCHDKNTDIQIIINECKKMSDIYLINIKWKFSLFNYLLNNYKKMTFYDIKYKFKDRKEKI